MTIMFVANQYQTGGATKSLFYLVKNLKETYNINPIILTTNDGILTEMCEKENIKYIKLKYKSFFVTEGRTKIKKMVKKVLFPIFKVEHKLLNKICLVQLNRVTDMSDVDIIHTNVNRDDFGALIAKKWNKPHVWHLREFGDVDYKGLFLRNNYIEFMNKNTTYFVAISEVIKKNFIAKGIDQQKIQTIYNGVYIPENYKKEYTKTLKILFMGSIQQSKGQHELIEALHLLPQKLLENIRVDFYGAGIPNYKKELLSKINIYNLRNINFYEYQKNIDEMIKNYDVGVMCSSAEAFGRVTVEYMANKLITVASNTGASPEIITKDTGFLYEHNNYQSLANVLEEIYYMNKIDREKMIDNAYNRVKHIFSDTNNSQNIYNLYLEILKNERTKMYEK